FQLQLMGLSPTSNYSLLRSLDLGSATSANNNLQSLWSIAGFVPIPSFSGTFTGSSGSTVYTLSNLNISQQTGTNIGLFAQLNAGGMISGVSLIGGSITGGTSVGALVGFNNGGTIVGSNSSAAVLGGTNVGGLVGTNNGSVIGGSYATGLVGGTTSVGG